jgi:hypothetical protein
MGRTPNEATSPEFFVTPEATGGDQGLQTHPDMIVTGSPLCLQSLERGADTHYGRSGRSLFDLSWEDFAIAEKNRLGLDSRRSIEGHAQQSASAGRLGIGRSLDAVS